MKPSIYSASKIWHAPKWVQLRDVYGFDVISTWIDYDCGSKPGPGEEQKGAKLFSPAEKVELWNKCGMQAGLADMVIVYAEKDDDMCGGLVELGGAITTKLLNPDRHMGIYLIGYCRNMLPRPDSDVAFMSHVTKVPESVTGYGTENHNYLAGYRWAVSHYLAGRFSPSYYQRLVHAQ